MLFHLGHHVLQLLLVEKDEDESQVDEDGEIIVEKRTTLFCLRTHTFGKVEQSMFFLRGGRRLACEDYFFYFDENDRNDH